MFIGLTKCHQQLSLHTLCQHNFQHNKAKRPSGIIDTLTYIREPIVCWNNVEIMHRKTGSIYWSMGLKIITTLDTKTSDVSGSDFDPDPDTAIDLDAFSSSRTWMLSSVSSLLSSLRALKPLGLARNRKMACNSAPHGSKWHKVQGSCRLLLWNPKVFHRRSTLSSILVSNLTFQQANYSIKPARRN